MSRMVEERAACALVRSMRRMISVRSGLGRAEGSRAEAPPLYPLPCRPSTQKSVDGRREEDVNRQSKELSSTIDD
jgi:hypothetical protein